MDRQQFLNLLTTKQYNLIAYHCHLENGKTRLSYENWVDKVNELFYYMNELCILNRMPPPFNFGDIVNQIVEKYFNKFNIISLYDKNNKLIGYM